MVTAVPPSAATAARVSAAAAGRANAVSAARVVDGDAGARLGKRHHDLAANAQTATGDKRSLARHRETLGKPSLLVQGPLPFRHAHPLSPGSTSLPCVASARKHL